MINSKKDYIEYVQEDKKALNQENCPFYRIPFNIPLRYTLALRRAEYWKNCKKGLIYRPLVILFSLRHKVLGNKYGFTIPLNTCEKGLSIAHVGGVVINSRAHIGEYCRIHAGVNIGTAAGFSGEAPTIGNRVYIGPGAKIFGKITIADDIAIGANAVVNKNFLSPGVTIAGVPAKIISNKGSEGLLYSPQPR